MDSDVYIFKTNEKYAGLRNCSNDFSEWFEQLIKKTVHPGDRVVIKPNLVKECQINRPELWEHVITHPEVIRFVLTYVVEALQNAGEICVVETPETYSDFQEIIARTKLTDIIADIQETTDVRISCFDLREERWISKSGTILGRVALPGDPKGYVEVNLKQDSEFADKINKNYYGADYDTSEIQKYHNDIDNIYVIARSVLDCDVYINLPKLKTHKLAGVTASMKNLVGVCVKKNSIPHHTIGTPENGGDRFPAANPKSGMEMKLTNIATRLLKYDLPIVNYPFVFLKKIAFKMFGTSQETIRNGAWYGNDTIWRSVIDLNKVLLYSDADGVLHDTPQRKYITLIDGIVGSEGNGPMEGDPIESGVLIAGTNPVYADTVAATIMGFDYRKLPFLVHAYNLTKYGLTSGGAEDIVIRSNEEKWKGTIHCITYDASLKFIPHFGWKGHVELGPGNNVEVRKS